MCEVSAPGVHFERRILLFCRYVTRPMFSELETTRRDLTILAVLSCEGAFPPLFFTLTVSNVMAPLPVQKPIALF